MNLYKYYVVFFGICFILIISNVQNMYLDIVTILLSIPLIIYGIIGIRNKNILPSGILFGDGQQEEMARAKNLPYFGKRNIKDFFVKGGWAIEAGIGYIVIGMLMIAFILIRYL